MAVYARDAKELGKALKNNEDEIIIEADLEKKIVKIKTRGNVTWAVAIGAIGVAVASIVLAPATGGTSSAAGLVAAPAAVSVLGASTTTAAISIAVAAGGVESLNKLRTYKIIKKNGKTMITKK